MTTSTTPSKRGKRYTPDSHDFPTRPYDLVKEMVVAGVILLLVTLALAAGFGSLDEKAITLQDWAKAAPNDVVATATGELAGTTDSSGYGPPYNNASDGQKLGPARVAKVGWRSHSRELRAGSGVDAARERHARRRAQGRVVHLEGRKCRPADHMGHGLR